MCIRDRNAHGSNKEVITCPHCDYKSIDMDTLNNHIDADHLELTLLGHITGNQTALANSFDKFKAELTTALNAIIECHNASHQEFFIMRQNNVTLTEKLNKMEIAMNALIGQMELNVQKTPKETQKLSHVTNNINPAVPLPGAPYLFKPRSVNEEKQLVCSRVVSGKL